MNPLKKIRPAHCALALGLSVAFACAGASAQIPPMQAAAAAPPKPADDARVLATVNGAPVTIGEHSQAVSKLVYQQLQMLGSNIGNIPEDQIKNLRETTKPSALEQLINVKLVMQAKDKANATATDEEIAEQRKQLSELLQAQGRTLDQHLLASGKTEADLKKDLTDQIRIEKILTGRTGPLQPGEAQVRAFYDQNKAQFVAPEQVRSSHILIKFPGDQWSMEYKEPDAAAKAPLRKKAEEALAKVRAGGDFAALAKEYSDDENSKVQGGDIGPFAAGALVKPYEDALAGLKVGEVSDIVESKFGYHIIKLTEKAPSREIPFEEVRGLIQNKLVQERFNSAMDSLIEDLRRNAKIEVLDPAIAAKMTSDGRAKLPERPAAQRGASPTGGMRGIPAPAGVRAGSVPR